MVAARAHTGALCGPSCEGHLLIYQDAPSEPTGARARASPSPGEASLAQVPLPLPLQRLLVQTKPGHVSPLQLTSIQVPQQVRAPSRDLGHEPAVGSEGPVGQGEVTVAGSPSQDGRRACLPCPRRPQMRSQAHAHIPYI